MIICKNAKEYWAELWRLRGEGFQEYYSKFKELRTEKEKRDLFVNCLKEAEDFDNQQPIKPLFIYRKGRKWHELKFIQGKPMSPGIWISPEPVDKHTTREKSNAWVLPIHFNGHPVDVVVCQYCKSEFIRFSPHQKQCPECQRFGFNPVANLDKHKYCLNCSKHLPYGKHGKTKYCCGACRTAACKKRKIIVSPS